MASACINNIGISPENFLDIPPATFPTFGWLSPRHSLSRDNSNDPSNNPPHSPEDPPDPDNSAGDFEFRLEDPVAMLPADELFSDGKLVPLHLQLQLSSLKPSSTPTAAAESPSPETSSPPATAKPVEPFLFSPKAPRCSSRWRELLGLKKKQQLFQSANPKAEPQKTTSSPSTKSLKHFLHHRSSKTTSLTSSSENASLSLPLLKDLDSESVSIESISISSRLSLSSSSSSGHDHEDLPRLSLDSDKPAPNPNPIALHRSPNALPRMRFVKPRAGSFDNSQNPNPNPNPSQAGNRVGRSPIRRAESGAVESRGVSVDSPRMNSSGKIVFQSLERSSSSPSSFNGGPRFKHRGMERSYSANVRVTPVLNVPVCSLRGSSKTGSVFGFGQFFSSSPQKKEGAAGGNGGGSSHRGNNGGSSRHRCDRN